MAGFAKPGGSVTRLFDPRVDGWQEHFTWDEALILPRTEIGAATIGVLRLNQPNAMAVWQFLMDEDQW